LKACGPVATQTSLWPARSGSPSSAISAGSLESSAGATSALLITHTPKSRAIPAKVRSNARHTVSVSESNTLRRSGALGYWSLYQENGLP
jgi:hypothetical protein